MSTLFADAISSRIPHRYENLLLDESTPLSNGASEFNVTIPSNDALERNIFHYTVNDSARLPTPILTEIAALACIVSSGAIKPGTFAYFAAITNFSLNGPIFKGDTTISGTTQKVSDKNGFHKYSFELSNNESQATGELMAYYDTSDTAATTDQDLPQVSLPESIKTGLSIPGESIDSLPSKQTQMTFIDGVALSTSSDALYRYTYPKSHPLIKGHFPSNPVMMGVCQWQMIEDAFTHYANQHQLRAGQYSLNASIFKDNQTAVCDIKKMILIVIDTPHGKIAHTGSVKKVMFKQRVTPNDHLFAYISAILAL